MPDDESIVCVDRSLGAPCIVQMNLKGEELRSRSRPLCSPRPGISPRSHPSASRSPRRALALPFRWTARASLWSAWVNLRGRPWRFAPSFPTRARPRMRNSGCARVGSCSWRVMRLPLGPPGGRQEAFPAEPRVYQQLARIHRRAGDRAAQLDCLEEGLRRSHGAVREAVTLDWQVGTPEARLVLEFVETTRKVRGDREAGRVLGQALKLYPCMEQAVILRAELLLASGKGEEAIASLEEAVGALEGSGDVGAALHDIGRFLERQGRHGEALLFMERSFAKGEFSEFLIRDIADLHVRINQPTVAARWLSRLEDHWGSVANGATGLDRSLRGHRRLTDLRREIEELEGAGAVVTDPRSRSRPEDRRHHCVGELVAAHPAGFALVAQDQPVAERWPRDGPDVLVADVQAVGEERAGLGRQEDRLATPQARPVADMGADGLGRRLVVRVAREDDRRDLLHHVRRRGHLPTRVCRRSHSARLKEGGADSSEPPVVAERMVVTSRWSGSCSSSLKRKRSSCASGRG